MRGGAQQTGVQATHGLLALLCALAVAVLADDDHTCLAVSTFAGNACGLPTSPAAVAVDSAGIVYISDLARAQILKVFPDGHAEPWLGRAATPGYVDGPRSTALLDNSVWGMAFLPDGRLVFTSYWSDTVRIASPNGDVATLAGQGQAPSGFADGPGPSALFHKPMGVAVDDANRRIFVADVFNHRIRAVSYEGVVTTLTGNGTADRVDCDVPSCVGLAYPQGLALDASRGILYVSDLRHTIRAVDVTTGATRTIAGSYMGYADGVGTAALFNSPAMMVLWSARALIVADTDNRRLRVVDTGTGEVTTWAGSGGPSIMVDGDGLAATFGRIWGLGLGQGGVVYVSEMEYAAVRRVSGAAGVTTLTLRSSGSRDSLGTHARFNAPTGLVVDAGGNILVADDGNHKIRMIAADGTVTTLAGTGTAGDADGPAASARFFGSRALALTAAGDVVIADRENHKVRILYRGNMTVATLAGTGGLGMDDGPALSATFRFPRGVAAQGDAVFVMDSDNHAIRMIRGGRVTTVAGNGIPGRVDGPGAGVASVAFADSSCGIAAAPDGKTIYFTQVYYDATDGHQYVSLRTLAPNASGTYLLTTVAGDTAAVGYDVDGMGADVQFGNPVSGLAFGPGGELYMAGYRQGSVRVMWPNGYVGTLAPGSPRLGYADGVVGEGAIMRPSSVAVDPRTGALYLADRLSNRVLRLGNLTGQACNVTDADSPLALSSPLGCRAGSYIDWTGRTCLPCPAGASTDGCPYSSYCVAEDGTVFRPAAAIPPPASDAGGIAAAVVLLLVCACCAGGIWYARGVSAQARSRLTRHKVQPSKVRLYETVLSASASSVTSPLASSGLSARSLIAAQQSAWRDSATFGGNVMAMQGTASEPVAADKIPWSDLLPDERSPVLLGGFGVVLRATWISRSKPVAVKLPRSVVMYDVLPGGAAEMLAREAAGIIRASDKGANDFVVRLHGVAEGAAGTRWAAAMARARAAVIAKESGGSLSSGSGGGLPVGTGPGMGTEEEGEEGSQLGPHLLALVMSWEAGGTLQGALFPPPGAPLAPWPATMADRLRILREVGVGLWHLHSVGLVHGDIKPENVLLSEPPGRGVPHARLADFGLAAARRAASRASRVTTAFAADDKRGTWPYMAQEMYGARGGAAAQAADARTDVYALGTLAWEVLSGQVAWAGYAEADRVAALREGAGLDMAALPSDTPRAVVALLGRCLANDRAVRPRMSEVRAVLEQAHEERLSGRFDVFLSHSWGAGNRRKPLTDAVCAALRGHGLRVWLDSNEMGYDMEASMVEGIARSDVVVALLSPDYCASRACMFELRTAAGMTRAGGGSGGHAPASSASPPSSSSSTPAPAAPAPSRPILVAVVEPGMWQAWSPTEEVRTLAGMARYKYADLSAAAGVDWAADAVSEEDRAKLTRAEAALPRLLTLIEEARAGAGRSSGSHPHPLPLAGPSLPAPPLRAPSASASATAVAVKAVGSM